MNGGFKKFKKKKRKVAQVYITDNDNTITRHKHYMSQFAKINYGTYGYM